jgi:hypothetical protein
VNFPANMQPRLGGMGVGWLESQAIHEALKEHEKAAPMHKLLLFLILTYRGKAGLMNPSLETLAEQTWMSVRSVQRALHDLRSWGLLDWKQGGQKGGQLISNHYKVGEVLKKNFDPLSDTDVQQSEKVRANVSSVNSLSDTGVLQRDAENENSSVGQRRHSSVGHDEQLSVGHSCVQGSTALEAKTLKQTREDVFFELRKLKADEERKCSIHNRLVDIDDSGRFSCRPHCPTAIRLNRRREENNRLRLVWVKPEFSVIPLEELAPEDRTICFEMRRSMDELDPEMFLSERLPPSSCSVPSREEIFR